MGQSPKSKFYSENPEDTILIQGNADMNGGIVTPRIYTSNVTKLSKPGDIILTVRAPVGELAINQYDACIGRGVCSISGNKFIYYLLEHLKENHYWERFSQGSTFESINSNDIKNMKVKIPSISIQNIIADFLTKIDFKISLMERKQIGLINYKKGLMQQLFSFNLTFSLKNTSNFKLDELFISKKGSGLSKESLCENGKNSCILYGELYTKYNEIISKVESKTDLDEGILSKKGDILIPASTTTKGEDLVTASIVFDENIHLGGDITILRLKNEKLLDSLFFAYYFSNGLVKKIAPLTQGSTIIHLYWKDFKKVSIDLPSLNEQKKIADFLSKIDNKIDSVEQQLEKIKEFKKYLLQQMFI